MADQTHNFTTPVGRIVQGDLYKARTTDKDGNPLVIKSGPNVGQPTQQFFFALAVPKTPGVTHWANEAWGAPIWAMGHAAFPVAAQRPDFAWKIEDGDSVIPNKNNRTNAKTEGFAGNWIIKFSSSLQAPRCFTILGRAPNDPAPLLDANAIRPGYYVQVAGNCAPNTGPNPGLYMNHSMVCLVAYGPEIVFGPDPTQAGFGVDVQLPPGATLAPVGGVTMPAAPQPPAAPAPHLAAPAAPAPHLAAPVAPAPAPAIVPHTAILNIPAPPPSLPARTMTPKAGAVTYEQYIAAGWTDAALIQNGYMVA